MTAIRSSVFQQNLCKMFIIPPPPSQTTTSTLKCQRETAMLKIKGLIHSCNTFFIVALSDMMLQVMRDEIKGKHGM